MTGNEHRPCIYPSFSGKDSVSLSDISKAKMQNEREKVKEVNTESDMHVQLGNRNLVKALKLHS